MRQSKLALRKEEAFDMTAMLDSPTTLAITNGKRSPTSSEDSETLDSPPLYSESFVLGALARSVPATSSDDIFHSTGFTASYVTTTEQRPRHRFLDQDGRPIKKAKLEYDSCRDLVYTFSGRMQNDRLPSADDILSVVIPVLPETEREIYSSWLSVTHRPTTIENTLQSAIHLSTHNQPTYDHYNRAVNKRREHDLGRNHTAPAVFWMIMTSLLLEHSYPDRFQISDASFVEFDGEFSILVEKARGYRKMPNFHLQLHKAHVFLKILFTLIKVDGFLEVCLLIVSCLEGRGKHHQRSGKNRPFPARAYRYLIEKTGEKVDIDQSLLQEFENSE